MMLRAGSYKDRPTKLTCTTRGRRWARSRKSSWRSRCAEIASATSSRAWYRSERVSQGDAECPSIGGQYGRLINGDSRGPVKAAVLYKRPCRGGEQLSSLALVITSESGRH